MSGDVHNMVRSYQLKKVVDDLNLYVWRKGNILELQMATNKYLYCDCPVLSGFFHAQRRLTVEYNYKSKK